MKAMFLATIGFIVAAGGAAGQVPTDNAGAPQIARPNGMQQQQLISCYYNASGAYTGADSAQPGATPGLQAQTGSGDYTYTYNIAAPDGRSCPRSKPGG